MKSFGNYHLVVCDTVNKIKNYEFETWFRNGFNKDFGIWVGNGIGDQYLFNFELDFERTRENLGKTFGYGIKQGDTSIIKLIGIENDEE